MTSGAKYSGVPHLSSNRGTEQFYMLHVLQFSAKTRSVSLSNDQLRQTQISHLHVPKVPQKQHGERVKRVKPL